MKTRVAKWGNSLALRLPKALAETHGLEAGSEVELTEEGDVILLRRTGKRYELAELLKGVRPGNRHSEVETGEPVGKEAW
ncbi:MAG: AbrB/MazE/SpoVT family DNA-binding domain-containing protein [Puniceicoccaceae bacterium]